MSLSTKNLTITQNLLNFLKFSFYIIAVLDYDLFHCLYLIKYI